MASQINEIYDQFNKFNAFKTVCEGSFNYILENQNSMKQNIFLMNQLKEVPKASSALPPVVPLPTAHDSQNGPSQDDVSPNFSKENISSSPPDRVDLPPNISHKSTNT